MLEINQGGVRGQHDSKVVPLILYSFLPPFLSCVPVTTSPGKIAQVRTQNVYQAKYAMVA